MPYFYDAWFSYVLVLLLVLTAVCYLISKGQIIKLKKANLQITQLLDAKGVELEDLTEKLKILENSYRGNRQLDEQLISMLLHDLRSPLRFLCTISRSLVSDFSNREEEKNLEYLTKLHKSVESLWSFVETHYAWGMDQEFAARLSIRTVSIQEIFDSVARFYEEILAYNGNALEVTPTTVCWTTDRYVLNVIVRNLLDNANKYTEAGKVCLSCHEVDEKLSIVVKDSGRGLEKSQIRSFMQICEQDKLAGNGSRIITHMLKKIDGHLNIFSEPGKGSVFTIELKKLNVSPKNCLG